MVPAGGGVRRSDIEGVYLQVEGPEANIHIDRQKPIGQFMEQELLRIVRTYGNHPSFLLMTLGNEHSGAGDTLDHWVKMLREEDARHFYSSASCGQNTQNSQFIEDMSDRGVQGPGTTRDVHSAVAGRDRPTIGHEIGQWTFFPNFDEIPKYKGVLQAKNFELVRDDLAKKHLLDLAPQFVQATAGRRCCSIKRRSKFSSARPTIPGFRSWICTIIQARHRIDRTARPILGFQGLCYSRGAHSLLRRDGTARPPKEADITTDEALTADVDISHFGPRDLVAAQPEW